MTPLDNKKNPSNSPDSRECYCICHCQCFECSCACGGVPQGHIEVKNPDMWNIKYPNRDYEYDNNDWFPYI